MKYFFLLLLFALGCATAKLTKQINPSTNKKHTTPIAFNFNEPLIADSVKDFIKVYLVSNGANVVSDDEIRQLTNDEALANFQQALSQNGTMDDLVKNFYSNGKVAGIKLSLSVYSRSNIVDSVSYNFLYMPFKSSRIVSRKAFIPHNPETIPALKEFCDSILISKEFL